MYTERIPDVLSAADQDNDDLYNNEDSNDEEDDHPQNHQLEPGQVIEFFVQGKPELDEWKRSAIITRVEEDARYSRGYHISKSFHVPLRNNLRVKVIGKYDYGNDDHDNKISFHPLDFGGYRRIQNYHLESSSCAIKLKTTYYTLQLQLDRLGNCALENIFIFPSNNPQDSDSDGSYFEENNEDYEDSGNRP